MKKVIFILMIGTLALSVMGFSTASSLHAREVLRYSCSAQIYEAIEKERIEAFTKKTGIRVYVDVWSSTSAVNALMRDQSDIASSTRALYRRHREYGYQDIPFCKDPLAIIVNVKNPVTKLSEEELVDIFQGNLGNWKELGGPDKPIFIIIPGKNKGAYRNFNRTPMRRRGMVFDLLSYKSTTVVDAVRRFPWSISFITQGVTHREGLKVLKIDGRSPGDRDYPYNQVFHYITKGETSEAAKSYMDYALSKEGKRLLKAKGMVPILEGKE